MGFFVGGTFLKLRRCLVLQVCEHLVPTLYEALGHH